MENEHIFQTLKNAQVIVSMFTSHKNIMLFKRSRKRLKQLFQ